MKSSNHEHFLDKNRTPLHQYIHSHYNDNEQDSSVIFSSQNARMDYVTLEGIENRTGVGRENLYGFILKELLDNTLDFLEMQSAKEHLKEEVPKAEVKVLITKEDRILRILVYNSNDYGKATFSKDKLKSIFNFDTFYSSKRNQYKVSRGALGDAFKEILCIPYALSREQNIQWNEPMIVRSTINGLSQTFLISLKIDRINQTIDLGINENYTKRIKVLTLQK